MTDASTRSGGSADRSPTRKSLTPAQRTARLLGWASFGLAAGMFFAPGRIARTFGLEGRESLIRGFGGQEMLAGVGALSIEPVPAMWARAGGDFFHIGTLAAGLRQMEGDQKRNAMLGLAAVAGFLVVDALVAAKLTQERRRSPERSRDYSDRSGFPQGEQAARGAAARDFETPADLRAPLPTSAHEGSKAPQPDAAQIAD